MVNVHPLVFLNLTDHYVRAVKTPQRQTPLLGILMGSTISTEINEINIVNSFEIAFTVNDTVDWVYLEKRLQQQAIILPNEMILGVYEIDFSSEDLNQSINLLSFKDQFASHYQGISLTSLVFNPNLLQRTTQEKILSEGVTNVEFYKIYQSNQIHPENKISNFIKTKDAEKVAIDTILSIKEESDINEEIKFSQFYKINKAFLIELETRIDIILEKLHQIKDYSLLRDINSLISKLNYRQGQDQLLSLVELENNLKFYMEVVISLQNLKGLEHIKNHLSMLPLN